MKIIFEGRVTRHNSISGVSRVAQEIQRQLSQRPDISFVSKYPSSHNILLRNFWLHFIYPFLAPVESNAVFLYPGNICSIFKPRGAFFATIVHSISWRLFPEAYSAGFRMLYRLMTPITFHNSDLIITVSKTEMSTLKRFYPKYAKKIEFVYNGVSDDFFVERETKEKKGFLYVGAISKGKNIEGILAAFLKCYQFVEDNLILVGSTGAYLAKNPKLKQLISLIPPSRITFIEQASDSDLRTLYNQSFLLLMPSFYESFGLPVVEAMKCGTPCIVSDLPIFHEITGDKVVYCDPADVDGIVGAIIKIIDDPVLYQELRQEGIKQASEYTWERSVSLLISHINRHLRLVT
jgi:glycosyltransferase involved in cell wall biosynthesis